MFENIRAEYRQRYGQADNSGLAKLTLTNCE